jgi:hypothetical protein
MKLLFVVAAGALALGCSTAAQTPATPSSDAAPTLTAVSPASGPKGTEVTITGVGFASEGITIKFGDGYIKKLQSKDGRTVRFTVPDAVDLCAPTIGGAAAMCPAKIVVSGTYTISVVAPGDSKSSSNELKFTVSGQ